MEDNGLDLLGDSLLQWVRSFEGVGEVQQWRDLSDGRALWTILQDVDSEYFTGALPEPNLSPSLTPIGLNDASRHKQNIAVSRSLNLEKGVKAFHFGIEPNVR